MNTNEFIDALKISVNRSSIQSTIALLSKPPGRRPLKEITMMSDFYNNQTDEDKIMIDKIIEVAVDMTVFSFLCVLDGVSAIENTQDKGELLLVYKKNKDSERVILNKNKDLHDLYNQ